MRYLSTSIRMAKIRKDFTIPVVGENGEELKFSYIDIKIVIENVLTLEKTLEAVIKC